MTNNRAYLDWNATAPLRDTARAAMVAALDLVGNPSSVHAEGRAAKAVVEKARAQVLAALGASGCDLVFTSGATEAAALALAGRDLHAGAVEHDAVLAWVSAELPVDGAGQVAVDDPARACVQLANSETGVIQNLPQGLAVSDLTQGFGRIPLAFNWMGVQMGFVSAHKIGGPKGIGALVFPQGTDVAAQIRGGGQEMGRRSGTENIAAIAGFGAAAESAQADLDSGAWKDVADMRDLLETALAQASPETIFVGKDENRLPNTSCFVTPGWKSETQVMVMDLAGFAISAGSACSSGKVRASRTLQAMGFSEPDAACAIRVSIGPDTTRDQVLGFARAWADKRQKQRTRAA